ncbi:DUF4339 domain-containing protein [Schlesneria paludicola]|uniref:DUF4339 domain-containing protein n=1 Tax=Schlesneria paludicola TaxID=360056 RepID=UPI00029A31CE|nr:DUF4339 domain-containing protein [Schlesneria paludicola]
MSKGVIDSNAAEVPDACWIYQTSTGNVGPITTEQFMEAVQAGVVSPSTLVRLKNSMAWMKASEIEGLEFTSRPSTDKNSSTTLDRSAKKNSLAPANNEMLKLFAECVDRQQSKTPKPAKGAVRPQPIRRRSLIGDSLVPLLQSIISYPMDVATGVAENAWPFAARALRSWIVWSSVATLIVIFAIPKLPITWTTQKHVYSTLAQIVAELEEFRLKNPTAHDWDRFEQRSNFQVTELLPMLQRNAKIDDPVSMSLLWLARDYIPVAIRDRAGKSAETDDKISTLLASVKVKLEKPARSRPPVDYWTMGIVAFDLVLACAAIAFFSKHWWSAGFARH